MSKPDEIIRRRNLPFTRLPSINTGVTILWIDNPSLPVTEHVEPLSQIDHTVLYYTKIAQSIKYIKRASAHQYLIIILNKLDLKSSQNILTRFQQCRNVRRIAAIASDEENFDFLVSQTSISCMISVHRDQNTMLIHLQKLIKDAALSFDDGLFRSYGDKQKSLRDLRYELGSYMWNCCYCLILAEMTYNSLEAKKQFLKECRLTYRGEIPQLAKISEFERTYEPNDAIKWYTKACFFHTIINKALRSEDALALYKCRYVIVDLCTSLAALADVQKVAMVQVYRGTRMARDEVEQLTVGSLVAANGFLSSSTRLDVVEQFLCIDSVTDMSPSQSRDDPYQFVQFTINVTSNFQDIILADVRSLSEFPLENEVIFGLNSTFVITNIDYNSKRHLWLIEMTVSSELSRMKRKYEAFLRNTIRTRSADIMYGEFLIDESASFLQAIVYFHRLMASLPAQHSDRPYIYYCLGRAYRFIGKNDRGLAYLRCAELMQRRTLPESAFGYGCTLAAIGILFSEIGNSARAVRYYERALAVHRACLPQDEPEMIYHINRLGFGYWQDGQYERGLALVNSIQSIHKQKLPTGHKSEAQTLHLKGLLYHALGNQTQALEDYQQALKLREALLGNDHPYVARTCYRLGLLHEERGEYSIALEHTKRTLNIQQAKYSNDHWEIKLTHDLLTRLQRTLAL